MRLLLVTFVRDQSSPGVYENPHGFSPIALRQLVERQYDLNSYAERVCRVLAELVTRKAA